MFKLITISLALIIYMTSAVAGDVTYRNDIKPLWDKQCAMCHGSNSPYLGDFKVDKKKFTAMMKGPRMDTYADLIFYVGWPDSGALMRRLDDGASAHAKGGKAGNMYQYLGGSDADRKKNLSLFKAWVGDGAWNLNRWKQRGDVPAITKEKMNKLKVKF